MSIFIQNINKSYGNQIALSDVSLEIEKGEIVGFLGPNGAGKSTLMKIISSYISQDSGTVKVCNFNTA
jgi:ABC-2 type transport system ATP-binding protein